MRILLDTNVIISGLLSRHGPPGTLLQQWLDEVFDLVTSQAQVDEFKRALTYPRLRDRISPEQERDFLANVEVLAIVVTPLHPVSLSPDPDDNTLLAIAVAGQVDLIVSGDKPGMLHLDAIEGIPVVTPREALTRLKTDS